MTAKEIYNIMKALEEIIGPEESLKVIKEFVEQQLDDEINNQSLKPNWSLTTPTPVDFIEIPNLIFTDTALNDISWTTDCDKESN